MATTINAPSTTLFFFSLILFTHTTFSADSPESSPSPSPQPSSDNNSPSPATPSPSPVIPNSPPAPPPPNLAPNSPSPAPSPGEIDAAHKKAPAPAPADGVSHADQNSGDGLERKDDSPGGLSGGKKAGVAVGVIAAVCVVGIGAVVYKKRQRNIRRSQYGNAARREML